MSKQVTLQLAKVGELDSRGKEAQLLSGQTGEHKQSKPLFDSTISQATKRVTPVTTTYHAARNQK
jgi:hypothetical protein